MGNFDACLGDNESQKLYLGTVELTFFKFRI